MIYKINKKVVTKKEWDAHYAKRQSLYGISFQDVLESPPSVQTDDTFLAGVGSLESQIGDKRQLETITKNAMRAGYRPKPTDFYNPMLADYEGDPKAFLNHGQGKSHIKKVLESKGQWMDRDGDVHSHGPEKDPLHNPIHKLSPAIVNRIKKNRIKENPDLAHADQRELEADIVATHGWNEDR